MNNHLTISLIKDRDTFHNLREEWNGLLVQSDSNTIFLTWEWLYNWWSVYEGANKKLFVILVRNNATLVGIAPFYMQRTSSFIFNEIHFLGTNIVCSDYLNFILPKGREVEIVFFILSYLKQNNHLWTSLVLSDIPSTSNTINLIRSFFNNHQVMITHTNTCYFIKLNYSWDSIYNAFSSKIRNTIKRKSKKLPPSSEFKFLKITSKDDIERHFKEFVYLNKTRSIQKQILSPFIKKAFLQFHKNITETLHKNNGVKFCVLIYNGQCIAALYLFIHNNKYYFYQSGFDPQWCWLSPGTLLFNHCIRTAYENGAEEFDFLRGDEQYKSDWTKTKRTNVRIIVYNRGIRGFTRSFQDSVIHKTKTFCKWVCSLIS